ncbi:Subtilisin inhibitor-like [Blastococcus sp. DSM 46786]|uniref:SSI family serine proteinase inhibitor n=1 Tax=Blastococcus sp. DSM 46786 TaxID=1798227 RepID=UPI0008CEEE64|nr:SSI family serine proteinase inhibitor [Blastococcus sp. DSM 46786]SEL91383.1 Subtilisin inhibitor-like [Blastococcus sp. DSM 46786]
MKVVAAVLLLAGVLLGACAGGAGTGGDVGTDGSTASGVAQAEDDLRIELDRGDGTPPETWTLTCGARVGGTHPQAEAACTHLAGMSEPFAPLPEDLVCTEQYGGPQTAHVTGRWNGEPVDLQLSRVDGCRISQWDSLGPLLPVPVGERPVPLG